MEQHRALAGERYLVAGVIARHFEEAVVVGERTRVHVLRVAHCYAFPNYRKGTLLERCVYYGTERICRPQVLQRIVQQQYRRFEMGRLTIRGQVVNELGRPVRGARVEIWDRDNGAPDDRILTRTTNSAGVFSGVSSEWEDENYVTLPIGGRVRVPDVLDLAFKVSKQGKTHQGPFIRVNDAISAPIIWPGAPIEAVAKVNGTECDDEAKLASELKKVLQAAPNKITITIYDDVIANAFAPLANRTSRRTFVETGISGISEGIPVPTPTDAFWVLAGVAIIIVASAAAAGVVLLGSAVLYALSQGYSKVNFEHSTDNGDSTLIVNIEK